VPDDCAITIDERTVPGERASLSAVTEHPKLSLTIEQDLPPMACDDRAFADVVQRAAQTAQDATSEHVLKPHATDAGWLTNAGTTCVVCGPAEPGEAHTENESVSLAVLDRCYEIYRTASEEFGQVM
jgi:acetylornithine deacetylase